jgi:hypothetical protein
VSGQVLKEITSTIALILLNEVDDKSGTGTVTKGAGARVGDNVRKVTTDVSAVVLTPLPGSTPSATTTIQNTAKSVMGAVKSVGASLKNNGNSK